MGKYVPLTITPEALAALDDEHDDVMQFKGPELAPWLVVIRRPTADEATAYKSMAHDPAKKIHANVKLISAIAVFPKKDTKDWNEQYSRWPLFPDGLLQNRAFQEVCGIEGMVEARGK